VGAGHWQQAVTMNRTYALLGLILFAWAMHMFFDPSVSTYEPGIKRFVATFFEASIVYVIVPFVPTFVVTMLIKRSHRTGDYSAPFWAGIIVSLIFISLARYGISLRS
jgi:hypothetical protein